LTHIPSRLATPFRHPGEQLPARLVRAALFLSLLLDTAARQGNIVGLDLDRDVLEAPSGKISIHIAGSKVKNGEAIRTALRPRTSELLRYYRDMFRHLHEQNEASAWLFPSRGGKHWAQTAANQTLQDLTARHIGMAINPHLVRAMVGLILEQTHPGAIGLVRDVLGHRNVATTERYYRRARPQASRQLYHDALDRQLGLKGRRQ
jgi:integrase